MLRLLRVKEQSSAEASVASAGDSFGPAIDPHLAEYERHVVAYRLFADLEASRDPRVVRTLRDEFQHFPLARCQLIHCWRATILWVRRQEVIEGLDHLLPCRLSRQDVVIAGLQRHKPGARNHRCNRAALFKGNDRVLVHEERGSDS